MFEQNIFQGPGTGTFTTHTFEIIFMLLVTFLLGVWLGWVLWSKYRQEAERLRIENVSLDSTATTLRQENEDLKKKVASLESEQTSLEGQVQNQNWDLEKLRNQLTVQESDLEKLQERNRQLESELGLSMGAEGTTTDDNTAVSTEPLPSAPLEEDLPDLETVADDAGESKANAEVIDPEPGLRPLDELESNPAITPPTPESIVPMPETPAEKPAPKSTSSGKSTESVIAAVTTGPRDDLKIVEGIGPKIEELLFNADITTYGQLAATSVQQLQDILDAAGSRFAMHDPGTWSAQALLAANGEWDNLKAYQDFLNAGKRPDK
ncbi:MAG: hypothetical protein KDD14_19735 [Saprospiraceae bacterium]|nr:hypothetical protein [Saprospiraceae bacterium]